MDYFSTFNLQKEPFSNSPDPRFFFQSRMHMGCLQRLELSIRLRRGMSVVLGEVGTGKTTLCRHLIHDLTADEKIETHLVLDPGFPDSRSFLHFLASIFHLPSSLCNRGSDWQIKNEIQKYLFRQGFEEGKILVLIIDEGQKIDGSSLEILRELLNYEANECKLLQIVIFAQTEFQKILWEVPSFADRIGLFTKLGPLGLRDTRALIRFRLRMAAGGHPLPELFTPLGYLAIHRATGGYPRKIIHLCHRVLLAMIIRNRTRAGWSAVRWAAKMAFPTRAPRKMRRLKLVSTLVILVLTGFFGGKYIAQYQPFLSAEKRLPGAVEPDSKRLSPVGSAPMDPAPAASIETEPHHQESPGGPTLSHAGPDPGPRSTEVVNPQPASRQENSAREPPESLGQIQITEGETLEGLIRSVYGAFTPAHLNAVRRLNPHIRRVRRVEAGTAIRFPALKPGQRRTAPGYCVALTVTRDLGDCYDFLRELRSERTLRGMKHFIQAFLPEPGHDWPAVKRNGRSDPLTILPFWNPEDGLRFALVLRGIFPDSPSASRALGALPPDWAREASVLGEWSEGTLFYSEDLPIDRQNG
jgi:general secretion pathway protein A